jgi:hypothetical protein
MGIYYQWTTGHIVCFGDSLYNKTKKENRRSRQIKRCRNGEKRKRNQFRLV